MVAVVLPRRVCVCVWVGEVRGREGGGRAGDLWEQSQSSGAAKLRRRSDRLRRIVNQPRSRRACFPTRRNQQLALAPTRHPQPSARSRCPRPALAPAPDPLLAGCPSLRRTHGRRCRPSPPARRPRRRPARAAPVTRRRAPTPRRRPSLQQGHPTRTSTAGTRSSRGPTSARASRRTTRSSPPQRTSGSRAWPRPRPAPRSLAPSTGARGASHPPRSSRSWSSPRALTWMLTAVIPSTSPLVCFPCCCCCCHHRLNLLLLACPCRRDHQHV